MGEDGVEALGVLARGADARPVHRPYDHRCARLAAEHVAELGGLVIDLVHTDPEEVHEHQLRYGPEARAAAPAAAPMNADSLIGVSKTRPGYLVEPLR